LSTPHRSVRSSVGLVAAINGDSHPQDVRKEMLWLQNFANIEEMNFDTGAQDSAGTSAMRH
jgi:hypothetical protein